MPVYLLWQKQSHGERKSIAPSITSTSGGRVDSDQFSVVLCSVHASTRVKTSGVGSMGRTILPEPLSSIHSWGDAKTILMGRFLCEAHRMRNLEKEETFLSAIEENIDAYVADVIETKGEVLYTQKPSEQLVFFEKMSKYLANKNR